MVHTRGTREVRRRGGWRNDEGFIFKLDQTFGASWNQTRTEWFGMGKRLMFLRTDWGQVHAPKSTHWGNGKPAKSKKKKHTHTSISEYEMQKKFASVINGNGWNRIEKMYEYNVHVIWYWWVRMKKKSPCLLFFLLLPFLNLFFFVGGRPGFLSAKSHPSLLSSIGRDCRLYICSFLTSAPLAMRVVRQIIWIWMNGKLFGNTCYRFALFFFSCLFFLSLPFRSRLEK